MLNLGGPNLYPSFFILFKDSSNTEAGSSPLKPRRILNVSMSRARSLLSSTVKSPRSASLLDLIPLLANRGDQLGSSGLHIFETLHIYRSNRGPKLGTVLKRRPYQCPPIQGKRSLLETACSIIEIPALYSQGSFAPSAPHLYIAQIS